MIYEGSRYEHAEVAVVDGARTTYLKPYLVETGRYQDYLTRPGDRFDILADRFLDGPEQWWRIAIMNPQFFYPDEFLPAGAVIRVPHAT